mmetsp:Transcript_100038/g.198447  ORF Transcript_100038/g.198447 Transcript_100038/m.198447 type:complete len:95 (-) Transcript_100038:663-947(-)
MHANHNSALPIEVSFIKRICQWNHFGPTTRNLSSTTLRNRDIAIKHDMQKTGSRRGRSKSCVTSQKHETATAWCQLSSPASEFQYLKTLLHLQA